MGSSPLVSIFIMFLFDLFSEINIVYFFSNANFKYYFFVILIFFLIMWMFMYISMKYIPASLCFLVFLCISYVLLYNVFQGIRGEDYFWYLIAFYFFFFFKIILSIFWSRFENFAERMLRKEIFEYLFEVDADMQKCLDGFDKLLYDIRFQRNFKYLNNNYDSYLLGKNYKKIINVNSYKKSKIDYNYIKRFRIFYKNSNKKRFNNFYKKMDDKMFYKVFNFSNRKRLY